MPAVTIERKQSPQDSGVTFYRLTGESFDEVQREVENIVDTAPGGFAARFDLPKRVNGKFIACGAVVSMQVPA